MEGWCYWYANDTLNFFQNASVYKKAIAFFPAKLVAPNAKSVNQGPLLGKKIAPSVKAVLKVRNSWGVCLMNDMVHTSLEKSWNFKLTLKSHGIWCWPGKMPFCLEKSLKISGCHWKIPILRSLIFFIYEYHVFRQGSLSGYSVAISLSANILHAFQASIYVLFINCHSKMCIYIWPSPKEAVPIWVHFVPFSSIIPDFSA